MPGKRFFKYREIMYKELISMLAQDELAIPELYIDYYKSRFPIIFSLVCDVQDKLLETRLESQYFKSHIGS